MLDLNLKSKSGQNCAIIKDMPDNIYHGHKEYWGSSNLKKLYDNSKEFIHGMTATPAMIFGTDFHCFLLQNDLFNRLYLIIDESKRGKMTIKDYKAEQLEIAKSEGRRIVDIADVNDFEGMRKSLFAWRHNGEYAIKKYIENNDPEVSYFIGNFEGIPAKIRPDILLSKLSWLGDLKVTNDASDKGFNKYHVKKMGYDFQMAYYKHIYEEITGNEIRKCFWLTVEPKAPYSFNPIRVPEGAIERGRARYLCAIEKAKTATSYDGYADTIPSGKFFNEMDWNEYDMKM